MIAKLCRARLIGIEPEKVRICDLTRARYKQITRTGKYLGQKLMVFSVLFVLWFAVGCGGTCAGCQIERDHEGCK